MSLFHVVCVDTGLLRGISPVFLHSCALNDVARIPGTHRVHAGKGNSCILLPSKEIRCTTATVTFVARYLYQVFTKQMSSPQKCICCISCSRDRIYNTISTREVLHLLLCYSHIHAMGQCLWLHQCTGLCADSVSYFFSSLIEATYVCPKWHLFLLHLKILI